MATIPYEIECDKEDGFIMDPNEHKSIGYVTSMVGLGLRGPLSRDLKVWVPYNAGSPPSFSDLQYQGTGATGQATVTGVVEKFSWNGAVGGAITIDFWVSQANAVLIKTQQQTTLTTTAIKSLAWWLAGYDQETKHWYEKSFPQGGSVGGILQNKDNPELTVDLVGSPVKDGIDVLVYKVSMSVVPAANTNYTLMFANSSALRVAKSWGLVVGKLASTAF